MSYTVSIMHNVATARWTEDKKFLSTLHVMPTCAVSCQHLIFSLNKHYTAKRWASLQASFHIHVIVLFPGYRSFWGMGQNRWSHFECYTPRVGILFILWLMPLPVELCQYYMHVNLAHFIMWLHCVFWPNL